MFPYSRLTFPVVLLVGFGVLFYIKYAPVPIDAAYVGSAFCLDCHSDEHTQWADSLHPKMMRRVDEKGAVLADFSEDNPDAQFSLDAAVWVIGSKWQQQFMGNDGEKETLLHGAWQVGKQAWETKNWDGWQVPEPLSRCHGCHTVGLNVENGSFVEPGIGCESCHGPGEWHVDTAGHGRIYSLLDSMMCGQCHTRGKSKDGNFFFPVSYKPGKNLEDHFDEIKPDYIQNSSHWWGNGRERKRHQEYFAWKQGGHANSLKSFTEGYDGKYGELTNDCLVCHAATAAMKGKGAGVGLDDVEHGITCAVCHYSHGDLDEPRLGCDSCHSKGAYFHHPTRNEGHIPCPSSANVQCVNCHMPLTGKNGGEYALHSHTPGIVQPKDTAEFGVPSSCANGECHQDRDVEWLQGTYEVHYGVGDVVPPETAS